MAQFFLLFEEWEVADQLATQAECCLGRGLEAYCEGIGPAPSASEIAEAKRLRHLASDRLRVWGEPARAPLGGRPAPLRGPPRRWPGRRSPAMDRLRAILKYVECARLNTRVI